MELTFCWLVNVSCKVSRSRLIDYNHRNEKLFLTVVEFFITSRSGAFNQPGGCEALPHLSASIELLPVSPPTSPPGPGAWAASAATPLHRAGGSFPCNICYRGPNSLGSALLTFQLQLDRSSRTYTASFDLLLPLHLSSSKDNELSSHYHWSMALLFSTWLRSSTKSSCCTR